MNRTAFMQGPGKGRTSRENELANTYDCSTLIYISSESVQISRKCSKQTFQSILNFIYYSRFLIFLFAMVSFCLVSAPGTSL